MIRNDYSTTILTTATLPASRLLARKLASADASGSACEVNFHVFLQVFEGQRFCTMSKRRKDDDRDDASRSPFPKKHKSKSRKAEDAVDGLRKLFRYVSSNRGHKINKLLKRLHVNTADSHGQTALHLVGCIPSVDLILSNTNSTISVCFPLCTILETPVCVLTTP